MVSAQTPRDSFMDEVAYHGLRKGLAPLCLVAKTTIAGEGLTPLNSNGPFQARKLLSRALERDP